MYNFDIIKELGKGAFATVYQVKRKGDNRVYAIKRVKVPQMSSTDKEHALNEIRVLASFTHPNIIAYKESFYTDTTETLDIVMENAEEGDLLTKIKAAKNSNTLLPEETIWSYLLQMLFGLKCLHDKKFIHRDLKSANVFLCKNNTAKIGDFNVSKRLKYTNYLQSQTGTPYYASPEIWLEKPYDMRTDIWSLGCIIYELAALKVPFKAPTLKLLAQAACKGFYEPIPSSYSRELADIIALLLVTDMKKRMSTDQLLANPVIMNKMKVLNTHYEPCKEVILDTIKMPKKHEDINLVLPKGRKYSTAFSLIKSNPTEARVSLVEPISTGTVIQMVKSGGNGNKPSEEGKEKKKKIERTKSVDMYGKKQQDIKKKTVTVKIDLAPKTVIDLGGNDNENKKNEGNNNKNKNEIMIIPIPLPRMKKMNTILDHKISKRTSDNKIGKSINGKIQGYGSGIKVSNDNHNKPSVKTKIKIPKRQNSAKK